MYRERAKGWLKHVDFMLLDVLSLELSFVLAYWIRMRSAHPYARSPYRNMGLALVLIDVAVIFSAARTRACCGGDISRKRAGRCTRRC